LSPKTPDEPLCRLVKMRLSIAWQRTEGMGYNPSTTRAEDYSVIRSFILAILSATLSIPVLLPAMPGSATAAETHTEFNTRKEIGGKENIFNLVFGPAPPLATQKGILLINSFLDQNGNHIRDPEDIDLDREISCRIDGIEYAVPAFIPGLAYHGSYEVTCTGQRYKPYLPQEDLFIERRGQVVRVDIPCQPSEVDAVRVTPLK